MENKTVRDWIESVEDVDVRIEIHQLLNKNNPKSVAQEILNTEYDCFSAALSDCFLFAGTPQGSEYWCDICLAEDLKIMSEEEMRTQIANLILKLMRKSFSGIRRSNH